MRRAPQPRNGARTVPELAAVAGVIGGNSAIQKRHQAIHGPIRTSPFGRLIRDQQVSVLDRADRPTRRQIGEYRSSSTPKYNLPLSQIANSVVSPTQLYREAVSMAEMERPRSLVLGRGRWRADEIAARNAEPWPRT